MDYAKQEAYKTIHKWLQSPEDLLDQLIERVSNVLIKIPLLEDVQDETQLDAWASMLLLEKGLSHLISTEPTEEMILKYTAILSVLEIRWKTFQQKEPSELPPMAQLEQRIGHWIPKTAPVLEDHVHRKYRLLISSPPHEQNTVRYLLALADSFAHSTTKDFSDLLQFIARRRTELPLPSGWPIPTYVRVDRTDPVWFVFGALMHFWPKQKWLLNKFKLFSFNYRNKSLKNQRIGLVLSVHKGLCSTWDHELQHPRALTLTPFEIDWMEDFVRSGMDSHQALTAPKPTPGLKPALPFPSSSVPSLLPPSTNLSTLPSHNDPYIESVLSKHIPLDPIKQKTKESIDKSMDRWKNQKFFMEFVPRASSAPIHTRRTETAMLTESEKSVVKEIIVNKGQKSLYEE